MNGKIVTKEEYEVQDKKTQGLSNIAHYIYIFVFLIFWLVGICILINNLKKNK